METSRVATWRLVEWQHGYSEDKRKVLSAEGKFKLAIETEKK